MLGPRAQMFLAGEPSSWLFDMRDDDVHEDGSMMILLLTDCRHSCEPRSQSSTSCSTYFTQGMPVAASLCATCNGLAQLEEDCRCPAVGHLGCLSPKLQ